MKTFTLRERILIEGIMPERALLRLKRAKIDLYRVKKIQKNQILFSVKRKDSEKVFAIYPNVCYNRNVYTPYVAKKIGAEGLLAYLEIAKKRIGLVLGALLFAIGLFFSDTLVLGVEFVGTDVYARETMQALANNGVRTFAPYRKGMEDRICAQLIAIEDVEYCSIKKRGFYLQVEIRRSPFQTSVFTQGDLIAKHSGTVAALTVLRGTPMKKIGETIEQGDVLVEDYFLTQDGGQVRVEAIARVAISCTYTAEIEADSEEVAFAKAYLDLQLSDKDEITKKTVCSSEEKTGNFYVEIVYTAVETINL